LTAVFHAAESAEDKVAGERNLHELTADLDLSAFVLFSSSAATLGAAGRGGSAAANAFLDALAMHRQALGLTATAIAWGPWAVNGVPSPAAEQLQRQGISRLDPETALLALQHALDREETALTVADLDWERFAPLFASARPRPLIDDLPEARRALAEGWSDGAAPAGAGVLSTRLPGARAGAAPALVLA